jgi:hypothetical protein
VFIPDTAVVRPSDGATTARDLAVGSVRPLDGTSLVSEAARPCDRTTGHVRVAGPGDIWLTGWARCLRGAWLMEVTGGTGSIGGMPLGSSAISGDSGP